MAVAERTDTGTRDWTPPVGEFRPSSLGACPRYAWLNARLPEAERPAEPIGKQVMMWAGHAAEHEWIRLENEAGGNWSTGYELDSGRGTCHPDALDWDRHIVAEIKFTQYKKPAPYHLAQMSFYQVRLEEVTGHPWSGLMVLLSKNGDQPGLFEYPPPSEALRARVKELVALHTSDEMPEGVCQDRDHAHAVKFYDVSDPKKLPPSKAIVCPMAGRCFPPPDDMEIT